MQITHSEAQKIELDILVKVAEYCEKHELTYYLAYGTCLGAIRHKGFIPWDNDVDIFMPRPDYEQFLKLVKSEMISDEIKVLDYHEIKTFPFLKVINNKTRLRENFLVTEDSLGIYIDIFPLDGFPDNEKEQERLFKKAQFLYKLYAFANYRFNTGSSSTKRLLKNILYPISRLVSSFKVCEKLNNLCASYPYEDANYVGNIVWGDGIQDIIPKDWLGGEKSAEFESYHFRIPFEYDLYLTRIYENYMELPPENQRVTHQFDACWKMNKK